MLRANFDHPAAPAGQHSLRHLVIEFAAPPRPEEKSRPATPLNLALVLDASGSMRGAPLAAAVQAACGVVKQLGPDDRLSEVSFASDVQKHLRAQRMDETGRYAAVNALRSLATRGCTNLSGGWLAGAECVAALMESRQADRNHVVMPSDGRANEGICAAPVLSRHAAALRDRGLLSSAVGVGERYSTTQLAAIAEHGGGRLHHAADPSEIASVVLGELDDVRSAAVHGLVVEVEAPTGVRAEVVDSCPVHEDGRRYRCELGSVLSGSTRRLVVTAFIPPLPAGERLTFRVHADWCASDSETRESCVATSHVIITSDPRMLEERNDEAAAHAARAWLAGIERRLVECNRAGLFRDARIYFDAQRQPFRDHCRDLPGGRELMRALRRAECLVRDHVPERRRKEIDIAAYKSIKGEIDKRRPDAGI